MSFPELTDYIFICINCSWANPLVLWMHNWHSTSNLFFLSLFYWKGKCSMENECRSPLISCTWAPMCLYIKSSAFLVISFIKESILTLGKWSSCYCLLLQTQIDFSLASMERSCAWALIDHFQCAPHSDMRKTLRKAETAKGGQSAAALSSECLQLLPGFPLTESAWFFWFLFCLIQVGNGWGSTKTSIISRYNTLD